MALLCAGPDHGLVLDPSPPSSLAFVFSAVLEREVKAIVVVFVDARKIDPTLLHLSSSPGRF